MYAETLRAVLSRPHLHEQAVLTGFCKRTSKLSPEVFFDLLFYCASRSENSSLSFMVSYLESKYGISIKKQSLDERFNAACVKFVESVLAEVLQDKMQQNYDPDLLADIHYLRIKDSTKFTLPAQLEERYKGNGGSCGVSKAGICIQFEYDLKSGRILDLSLTPAVRNDHADASETAENVEKGDLVIRDLGYCSTAVFEKFGQKGVYFLSRLESLSKVFDSQGKEVCFEDLYKKMRQTGISEQEMWVKIGLAAQLPVRLIIRLVPEEVYQQRIRERTKAKKKRKKGNITQETRIRCRFNLFITNADEKLLPIDKIFPLYRLRWQVELMFKCWKSVFKIDRLQPMKTNRYIAMLCARLLFIIINMQLTYRIQQSIKKPKEVKNNWILSINKTMKTLSSMFEEIFGLLRSNKRKSQQIAKEIQRKLSQNHFLESKKNKLCFPEIISLFTCVSEK